MNGCSLKGTGDDLRALSPSLANRRITILLQSLIDLGLILQASPVMKKNEIRFACLNIKVRPFAWGAASLALYEWQF